MLWLVTTKGCTHSEPNCALTTWFYYPIYLCIINMIASLTLHSVGLVTGTRLH
nr:MAG TPA: hypothetical protein [Crassvirales sp.]